MKGKVSGVCIFLLGAGLFAGGLNDRIQKISREEMQAVVEFLSHDLLEGRAPGTRGGDLAELYMRSVFKLLGLEPGINGSYLQPFSLQGFTLASLEANLAGRPLDHDDDIVGTFARKQEEISLTGELVFVGFGIRTPLWDWDDYKDVDLRGKIVVARVNDPGMFIPEIFEGATLTYFGRWTYHVEEAARRGAAGILLIHTDASAGYSWKVVQNSWGGESLYLDSDLDNDLAFRGWIREAKLREVLSSNGRDLDELYRLSLSREFHPVSLGLTFTIGGSNRFRTVMNRNVVAHIPGPSRKRIVISAHIDHFGIVGDEGEDCIFNGAIDNGTAVAAMVLVAKILREYRADLRYSVTFLACNAEEAGLLGSKYYVQTTDRETIVANLNFESTPVWEAAGSVMGVGARFSTLEDMLRKLATDRGLAYTTFSMSNQGFFYRSDQFSFARYGIPAIWISAGEDDASGERKYHRFWAEYYHTVDDEYDPDWPLAALRQTVGFALLLIDHMNRTGQLPAWKAPLTFPLESASR